MVRVTKNETVASNRRLERDKTITGEVERVVEDGKPGWKIPADFHSRGSEPLDKGLAEARAGLLVSVVAEQHGPKRSEVIVG